MRRWVAHFEMTFDDIVDVFRAVVDRGMAILWNWFVGMAVFSEWLAVSIRVVLIGLVPEVILNDMVGGIGTTRALSKARLLYRSRSYSRCQWRRWWPVAIAMIGVPYIVASG